MKTMRILTCGVCFFMAFFGGLFHKGEAYAAEEEESVELPVLMYHSVTTSGKSRYIVTPEQMEQDLVAILDASFTPVFASEVIAYAAGEGTLPEKPVLLTFDDGHYNVLKNVLPLFEKYGACGVVCVIGKYTEYASTHIGESHKESYSYLTWDDISLLEKSGFFEIGNHSYDMHEFSPRYGIGRIKGESDEVYREKFLSDTKRLECKIEQCGCRKPRVYAYPFGRYNKVAKTALVSCGYAMTLTCEEGISKIKRGDKESVLQLKRFNRESSYSSQKVAEILSGTSTE